LLSCMMNEHGTPYGATVCDGYFDLTRIIAAEVVQSGYAVNQIYAWSLVLYHRDNSFDNTSGERTLARLQLTTSRASRVRFALAA
jgi:hypothetical protein